MNDVDDTVNEVMSGPYLFVLNKPYWGSVEVRDSATRTFVGDALVLEGARLDFKLARPHPDGLIVMAGPHAYVVAESIKPLPGSGTDFYARSATPSDLELAGVRDLAGWSDPDIATNHQQAVLAVSGAPDGADGMG